MVFILETQLSTHKTVFLGLQEIYGINRSTSNTLCKKLGFCSNLKIDQLTNTQLLRLVNTVSKLEFRLSYRLRNKKKKIFNNLIEIKSNRGKRLLKGLPVRGQRTHTNSRSARKKFF